ncbi:MAG: hemagglutinin-like protein [Frankiales bacterium]|nr:hemagglutinin-like protein [Frankiales bacterium]
MRSPFGRTVTGPRSRHRSGARGPGRPVDGGRRSRLPRFARRAPVRTAALVVLALGASLLFSSSQERGASATPVAADFDPGNIISDAVFFDSMAMSDDQVQAFLSARGASCVAGEQACLKDFIASTLPEPADGYCQGYTGGLSQSAAQIIGGVARSCGVSPRVLLVLLEKEQGLVGRTKPATWMYTSATGYGCPDTATCNNAYAGFFYQVYMAARQYQIYAATPGSWNYKAGQWNAIHYNPNYACGTTNVFIANQATAGLYIYTPYVPNAAAMANLYGLGDACSAYGNRNFWRIFSDWFGNPQAGSYLLRTPDNGTVYLVSGTNKYPIGDMATVSTLSPLGGVGVVSQQYLDRRTTGPLMSRVVLAPNGSVYFLDSGIKLGFSSCAQVADYGASCSSLVSLEQAQIDAFYSGPLITLLYRTTSGKAFYVSGGAKREVVDDTALAQAGLGSSSVTLQEPGLASLPYGVPVSRDGVVIQNRQTGAVTVSSGGGLTTVPEGLRASTALSSLPVRPLDDPSVRQLPAAAAVTGPILRAAGTSNVYLLTEQGKRRITDATMVPPSPQDASASLLSLFPDAGTLDAGTFVKGSSNATVFLLNGGRLRGIGAWADLVSLGGGNPSPSIRTVDQRLTDLIPTGPVQLGPGTLVVSNRSATVYFVNGASELIPVSSFGPTAELGATRLVRVDGSVIDAYTARPDAVSSAIDCGTTQYLGLGGKLYRVTGADVTDAYRLGYTSVNPMACAALPKASTDLTRFLRAADGTIFYMEAGAKRPIRSYTAFLGLGGTSANTIQASAFALSLFPTGALV